jgi:hypothetical protein
MTVEERVWIPVEVSKAELRQALLKMEYTGIIFLHGHCANKTIAGTYADSFSSVRQVA